MTDEEKAEEYADKILSDSKYPFIFSKEKVKEYIIKVYLDSLKCCENAYNKGLAEGRKEKCNSCGLRQQKRVNLQIKKQRVQEEILLDRILTLQKTNGSLTDKINALEAQIEKMKNIIYEEVDFCSYCPLKDCRNDEGVCPCANISKEEQEEILIEWITKNES